MFWEEDDDVVPATTAATWLADATRRGRDATMLVVGSDKGGKGNVADAVVSACAAFLDLHAFRANERAAAKAEKGSPLEKGRAKRGSGSGSAVAEPIVETGLSISVYQTRGLHADDLLAGFGGATGLRVKPGPEYAEGVGQTGTDEGSNRAGGLLYEVEDLTRVDCADLRDVRETLALARARRDGNGLKRPVGSETPAATVSELWITTTETSVDGLGDDARRTVRRRCARVVDVGGGDGVKPRRPPCSTSASSRAPSPPTPTATSPTGAVPR